ncbi:MarR family winged helix-turn-helix transcriptional regulator [Blastococcus sp. SYSU D00820]
MSRYARAVDAAPGQSHYTLAATEKAVVDRIAGLSLDMDAMAAVQNVYRAASEIRNHLERTVLAPHGLTWTGWVVLWVVWIWGDIETRHVAAEAGISKGTLTGVAKTLEARGLLHRRTHPDDARRVLLSLTPAAQELMESVFPQFNKEEAFVVAGLSDAETTSMTAALRKVVAQVQGPPRDPEAGVLSD